MRSLVERGREQMGIKLYEVEDCVDCPLLDGEICKGGMTSGTNGPIEPPCCSMDGDTDLDEWVKDYYIHQKKYEDYLDKKIREQKEKERKADIAKRKRNFLNNYCFKEAYQVKSLEKSIKKLKKSQSSLHSLAMAINLTNEMFRYDERVQENPELQNRMNELELQLEEAKLALKEKQKEGRKTREYKSIV